VSITWSQALAWRLQRQLLEPVGRASIADVIRRLGAVLATDERSAELAIGARRARPRAGELRQSLMDGRIIKAFAFRGATHYLSPEDGGAYLALRSAGRQWELPSWEQYYQLKAADWPAFRESVRAALEQGPLTIAELGAVVTRKARYRHLRAVFDEGAGTLIKPLTWQGDMSFGPPRDGQHTFQRLEDNPRWAGVWDLEKAGPYAIIAYLRSYGPARHDQIHYWLGEGLSVPRKRLQGWLATLNGQLVAVDVEGETTYVLDEDVDALMSARPTEAVRFLPGHDQWVMGPGTRDEHVVPAAHRTAVTRKANLVVAGGVVSGTWVARGGEVEVTWFKENGAPPQQALREQIEKLAALTGR
jgi:Winged helix DNA-binding domain